MQPTNSPIGILIWHIPHDQLIELLTEPLQNRIDYIKAEKTTSEIPIRLKWLTPVQHPEKMPKEFVKAQVAYNKAWEACKPQIEALHREEHPGCPWNGETLFGDKEV